MIRFFVLLSLIVSSVSFGIPNTRTEHIIFHNEALWIKSGDDFVAVKSFGLEHGKPMDYSGEVLEASDAVRTDLNTLFTAALADKATSAVWHRRAWLFTIAERVRTAAQAGDSNIAIDTGIRDTCVSCHTKESKLPHVTHLIDNTPLWEEYLNSPDAMVRENARKALRPLHRTLVDRGSMPRLDPESLEDFHATPEVAQLVEFLKEHHVERFEPSASVGQLLSASKLAAYRKMIPQVASPEIRKVLSSEGTFFYDESIMPQAYVDDEGVFKGFLYARDTIAADRPLIIARSRFRFPFGHTFGMHDTPGASHFNFLHLPTYNGARLPVALVNGGARWVFPEGTVIGEVLYQTQVPGGLAFELRVSWKENGVWKYDVFRPFPTSEHLLEAVTELQDGGEFGSDTHLTALKTHLEDPNTLKPDTLNEAAQNFNGIHPVLRAGRDTLPPLTSPVVRRLMKRPFRSTLGAIWRGDLRRKLLSYAPTGSTREHIAPTQYKAHFYKNQNTSCTICHSQARKDLLAFFPGSRSAELELSAYGALWGSDQKFSFFPLVPGNDEVPRRIAINPALIRAGVVREMQSIKVGPGWYRDTTFSR